MLRVYHLAFVRMKQGPRAEEIRRETADYLEPLFPTNDPIKDADLCRLSVYLDVPRMTETTMRLIESSVTSQRQLSFLTPPRHPRSGWTSDMTSRCLMKQRIGVVGAVSPSMLNWSARTPWNMCLLISVIPWRQCFDLYQRNDLPRCSSDHLFVIGQCPICLRYRIKHSAAAMSKLDEGYLLKLCALPVTDSFEGGTVGPDLTAVGRRLNTRDLLEAIVEHSRVISDQFAASTILTSHGKVITGRVVNLAKGALLVQTDMLDPAKLKRIPKESIEEIHRTKTSMMPSGLLNSLTRAEIIDLLAFLTSASSDKMSLNPQPLEK